VTAGRHGLLARKSHLWVSLVGLRASLGYVCVGLRHVVHV